MKYKTKSVAKAKKITAVKARSYNIDFFEEELDMTLAEDSDKNQDFFAIGQLKAIEGYEFINAKAEHYRLQYGPEAALQFLRGVSSVFHDEYFSRFNFNADLDSFSIGCDTNYGKSIYEEGYSYIHTLD